MKSMLVGLGLCCWVVPSLLAADTIPDTALIHAPVKYVNAAKVGSSPIPPVVFRRAGLVTASFRTQVVEKVAIPIILETKIAVAAIVVEFYPGQQKEHFGVEVIHANGILTSALIYLGKDGGITDTTYKQWFPEECSEDEGDDCD